MLTEGSFQINSDLGYKALIYIYWIDRKSQYTGASGKNHTDLFQHI